MYADDTSVLNIGGAIREHQRSTSENAGLVEQHFETTYL
jgi:hypothetical protein